MWARNICPAIDEIPPVPIALFEKNNIPFFHNLRVNEEENRVVLRFFDPGG